MFSLFDMVCNISKRSYVLGFNITPFTLFLYLRSLFVAIILPSEAYLRVKAVTAPCRLGDIIF